MSLSNPKALAQTDNWNVDGEHGELYVKGVLTESACSLDMSSSFQSIELSNIAMGVLTHPGDRGVPVKFQIRLRDCLKESGDQLDNRTGNHVQSANQPIASVAFLASEDADSSGIIDLTSSGISGIGLQLMDSHFHIIQLGNWNRPEFFESGLDDITFYIVPVRTRVPMTTGTFRATVNLHIKYD
ncbi:fimbrial protein [Kluyvera intermedia]|uniref:fimbrial protein n=1 Tax=Kluyvera intermedia TaxID=61648 RepID=UPI003523CC6D